MKTTNTVIIATISSLFACLQALADQVSPPFEKVETGMVGVWQSAVAWGDYDDDGDLDLLLTGSDDSFDPTTKIYRNDNNIFVDVNAAIPGISSGCVAWGDYEDDGDLDVYLSGVAGPGTNGSGFIGTVYRNDDGSFVDIGASLPGLIGCSIDLADYDDDGDLDVLISGSSNGSSGGGLSEVYRNDQGSFTNSGAGLPGVTRSSVDWGDYDNDGDLDIFLMGWSSNTVGRVSRIYNNQNGVFADIGAGLLGLSNTSGMFGDYDGDGDLDVVLTGHPGSGSVYITKVYRNDSGFFYDINVNFPSQVNTVKWGDYDADGDLDLLLFGETPAVFTNHGNDTFAELNGISLPAAEADNQSAAWADFDGDGCLDFIVTGGMYDFSVPSGTVSTFSDLYRYVGVCSQNDAPTAVAGTNVSIRAGEIVQLDGSGSYDDNTAASELLYSWSFGTLPVGSTTNISGADTATPNFVADIPGAYVVQLIVTDEAGLDSDVDEVTVSSDNLAPTAIAGDDQLVIVGDTVYLDGSGSIDPEADALTFAWAITSAPASSAATLSGGGSEMPSFLADLEGVYEVILTVSDFIGPGASDTVAITVASAEDFAEIQIVAANDDIAALESGEVTTGGNQNALLNFLSQAIAAIQEGDIEEAIDKLEKALIRTDGCVLRGSPDGNGPGRDWIIDCDAQIDIYAALSAALDALTP